MMKRHTEKLLQNIKPAVIYEHAKHWIISLIEKLKNKYPVFQRYPILFYLLIPILIIGFIKARYFIEFVFKAFITWVVGLLANTYGIQVPYFVIAGPLMAALLFFKLRSKIRRSGKPGKIEA